MNVVSHGNTSLAAVLIGDRGQFLFPRPTKTVWYAFPEPFMQFMTALFHGIDFHTLQSGKATLGSTAYADVILGGWAFVAATFFAWLSAKLPPEN